MSVAIAAVSEDLGRDASPLSLSFPDYKEPCLPSSSTSGSSIHFPPDSAPARRAAETPNANFFSFRSRSERSSPGGPGSDPITGSRESGGDILRLEGTIRPLGHLYWRLDGAEREAAGGLSGERRPKWQWPILSDRSWSVAKGTGFARGGPRSVVRAGPSTSRSRRGKQAMRLAARRFFYPGPIDFNPASDSRFIPLDGAALWFLRAPAQSVQQAADMIDVIMDTKRLVDDLADTRTSPQICGVACGSGSTKQNRLERFFGDLAQLGGPARCRLGPNRPVPFLQESRLPPAYAAPAYAEPPSDFHRLVPFLKKRDGAQTTLLKNPWTAGWSHVLPPA